MSQASRASHSQRAAIHNVDNHKNFNLSKAEWITLFPILFSRFLCNLDWAPVYFYLLCKLYIYKQSTDLPLLISENACSSYVKTLYFFLEIWHWRSVLGFVAYLYSCIWLKIKKRCFFLKKEYIPSTDTEGGSSKEVSAGTLMPIDTILGILDLWNIFLV